MGLPIFNTYINFSRHHFCCFTVTPLFVLDKSTAWNRCLQHPCFKKLCKIAQASKNSDSNAQHFLLDLLTHSWFHSMLFALPVYQFPYIVKNRCFYLTDIYLIGSQLIWCTCQALLQAMARPLCLNQGKEYWLNKRATKKNNIDSMNGENWPPVIGEPVEFEK
jgi:hypothetical protein